MTVTTPPATLPVLPTAIPQELRRCRQWVCWRWEWRRNRWTKVPLIPATGRRADATAPATWGTFDQALARQRRHRLPGVGFVFSPDDPYAGVDLDRCRDRETGTLTPLAAEIVALLNSYTEVSPTGTGLKVVVRATVPGPRRKHPGLGVEMYDRDRFFTITGHRYGR